MKIYINDMPADVGLLDRSRSMFLPMFLSSSLSESRMLGKEFALIFKLKELGERWLGLHKGGVKGNDKLGLGFKLSKLGDKALGTGDSESVVCGGEIINFNGMELVLFKHWFLSSLGCDWRISMK